VITIHMRQEAMAAAHRSAVPLVEDALVCQVDHACAELFVHITGAHGGCRAFTVLDVA
jgi:hypothetical protein